MLITKKITNAYVAMYMINNTIYSRNLTAESGDKTKSLEEMALSYQITCFVKSRKFQVTWENCNPSSTAEHNVNLRIKQGNISF